jgi:hypothetical protein
VLKRLSSWRVSLLPLLAEAVVLEGLAGPVKVPAFRDEILSRLLSMPWALTGAADATANRATPAGGGGA